MKMKAGDVFVVPYPFVRDKYSGYGEDGPFEQDTWRPGTRSEMVCPDDCENVADSMGEMVLTVVDVHKPGKYPERVFYTRKWRDPDGHEFGRGNLHITTTPAFKRRADGFMYEYVFAEDEDDAATAS